MEVNSGNKLQLRMAKTQPEGNSFLNSNFEDQDQPFSNEDDDEEA